jgi:uncharacterized protein YdcH (DUF465 family)
MSHAEIINYGAEALKCKAVCEIAHKQLNKLDDMIAQINQGASKLVNERIKEFEKSLIKTRDDLHNQIDALIQSANSFAEQRVGTTQITIVQEANELKRYSDELATTKLNIINDMIIELLDQEAKKKDDELFNKAHGIITLSKSIFDNLSEISDVSLRESIYLEAIKEGNQSMSFESLIKLGKEALSKRLEESLSKNKEKIIKEVRTSLQEAKIDETVINNIINSNDSVTNIQENATNEIISESVRKKSISIIAKNIEERGFVVDKKNIRLDKEKNEVNFVATKPNGQRAEFKIFLNGKFIYKFGGYEGQSCQKDITPFMSDLEEVYGWKINSQESLWSNPDKDSTQKYQTINKNKGKN